MACRGWGRGEKEISIVTDVPISNFVKPSNTQDVFMAFLCSFCIPQTFTLLEDVKLTSRFNLLG